MTIDFSTLQATNPGLPNPNFGNHEFFHRKSGDFYLKLEEHVAFFLKQKPNFHSDERFFLSRTILIKRKSS